MAIGITRTSNSQVTTVKKNQGGNKTSAAGSQGGSKTEGSSRSQQNDSVNLTASATQMQELENKISSMPVVDAAIVDSVQQQLSTGNYEVNEERTADKMLTAEKNLSGSS